MSDVINALKGFPFEQFFCLLMFGIVVWVLKVLNGTLLKLEKTLFAHTFILDQVNKTLQKCQDFGKQS